jgi:hypothetical protein
MASTAWSYPSPSTGPDTATWDGVKSLTNTVTSGGAFLSSFAGQALALSAGPSQLMAQGVPA